MNRRPFKLLASASLLLCVATAGLWTESEFATDFWYRAEAMSQVSSSWGAGELSLAFIRLQLPEGPKTPEWHFNHIGRPRSWGSQALRDVGSPRRTWDRLGFHFLSQAQAPSWGGKMTLLTIPFWFPAVLTLILPGCRLSHVIMHRRRKALCLCFQCGYNLTANLSGICPECGMPIKVSTVSKT